MKSDSVITRRNSSLRAAGVPLLAALLAADAAAPAGFRPHDVRFYFLLFLNWMGEDHRRPDADLDLTQVRRVLQQLAAAGHARGQAGGRPRWGLQPDGVLQLVEELCDPRVPRRLEEVLLVATVADAYAEVIAARVEGGVARRVRQRLDGRAIVRAERRRLVDALAQMEARRDAGPELARRARAALAEGRAPDAAAAAVEAHSQPYQLHPMRPYRELVAGLPPTLARLELEAGHLQRARLIFAPLAEELRGRIAILERLEAQLRG